jgi:hypothetical protein
VTKNVTFCDMLGMQPNNHIIQNEEEKIEVDEDFVKEYFSYKIVIFTFTKRFN